MNTQQLILTGKTEAHLVLDSKSSKLIHREMQIDLNALREKAEAFGFKLEIASSFRSFEQQLKIWNAKARGERTLLDSEGKELAFNALSKKELMYAILRWSALPGASRHHWGSDIDVFDSSNIPEGYIVQLTTEETTGGGVFAPFHTWLDSELSRSPFYRPYSSDTGGIAPEKWHISYRPVSEKYMQLLSYDLIEEVIANSEIELKTTILTELPEVYSRFIHI